jgi:hypothetical protein
MCLYLFKLNNEYYKCKVHNFHNRRENDNKRKQKIHERQGQCSDVQTLVRFPYIDKYIISFYYIAY